MNPMHAPRRAELPGAGYFHAPPQQWPAGPYQHQPVAQFAIRDARDPMGGSPPPQYGFPQQQPPPMTFVQVPPQQPVPGVRYSLPMSHLPHQHYDPQQQQQQQQHLLPQFHYLSEPGQPHVSMVRTAPPRPVPPPALGHDDPRPSDSMGALNQRMRHLQQELEMIQMVMHQQQQQSHPQTRSPPPSHLPQPPTARGAPMIPLLKVQVGVKPPGVSAEPDRGARKQPQPRHPLHGTLSSDSVSQLPVNTNASLKQISAPSSGSGLAPAAGKPFKRHMKAETTEVVPIPEMNNRRLGRLDQDREDKRQVLAVLKQKARFLACEEAEVQAEESDDHRVIQRRKQILFGKVTPGYHRYLHTVPPFMRHEDNDFHPVTPRADTRCSKRHWDLLMQIWRRQLHLWDGVMDPRELLRMTSGTLDFDKVPVVDRDDPARPLTAVEKEAYVSDLKRHLKALTSRVELAYGTFPRADLMGETMLPSDVHRTEEDQVNARRRAALGLAPEDVPPEKPPLPVLPDEEPLHYLIRLNDFIMRVQPVVKPVARPPVSVVDSPSSTSPTATPMLSPSVKSVDASNVARGNVSAVASSKSTPLERHIEVAELPQNGSAFSGPEPFSSRHPHLDQPAQTNSAFKTPPTKPRVVPLSQAVMNSLEPSGTPNVERAGSRGGGGELHPDMLPSPAKGTPAGAASLSYKPINLFITGQAINAAEKRLVGGPIGFRLDCQSGGSAQEVLAHLASSYDVSKLSFHVVRPLAPVSPPRSDVGPPDTEATATPTHRDSDLNESGASPSVVTPTTSSCDPALQPPPLNSQPSSPTTRNTPGPVRPFVLSFESSMPSAPMAIRTFAQQPAAAAAPVSTMAFPYSAPRPLSDRCTMHSEQCAVYRLDTVPNVAYFLSFHEAGLPVVYFEQVGELPFKHTAGLAGNPHDYWRSITPLFNEATLDASPPTNDVTFRNTVSPETIRGILDGAPAQGPDATRLFRSPTPSTRANMLENRLDLQTPIDLNSSLTRPMSGHSPGGLRGLASPYMRHNPHQGSAYSVYDRESSFDRDPTAPPHGGNNARSTSGANNTGANGQTRQQETPSGSKS
jgi:hypothetical protein